MALTLAESLAMAVLKGDTVAAYALADALLEERERGGKPLDEGYRELIAGKGHSDGYVAYHWPEFRAFCKRAGILWSLNTISITIKLEEGAAISVDQQYRGVDMGEQE